MTGELEWDDRIRVSMPLGTTYSNAPPIGFVIGVDMADSDAEHSSVTVSLNNNVYRTVINSNLQSISSISVGSSVAFNHDGDLIPIDFNNPTSSFDNGEEGE